MTFSALQYLVLGAYRLSPSYAAVARLVERMWRAGEGQYVALTLERLNKLALGFRAKGLLEHAAGAGLPIAGLAELAEWPVLERQVLQALFPRLKQLYERDDRYLYYQSGGSTGEPTQLYRLKTTSPEERFTGLSMLRLLGWRPGVKRVTLWGSDRDLGLRVNIPRGIRASVNGLIHNIEAIGGYSPDDAVYRQFIDRVAANPGCAVYGYTGLLEQCAQLMLREGRELKPGTLSAFWCTAEMLLPQQRELLREAFGLPVRDFYGSRECPWMAAECQHGTRHIHPRYFVEVLDQDRRRLPQGAEGELAVTDLFNTATPLIRYMIGDLGAVRWQRCACGRNGLALTVLSGRTNDMILLNSGRYLSSVFFPQLVKQFPGIRQAQLVRRGPEHFVARYVGDLAAEDEQVMAGVLSTACEGARAEVTRVSALTLTREGKLLPYIDETRLAT